METIFTPDFILSCLLLVSSLAALWFVFKRMLMMLQQNSYRNDRFAKWLHSSNESTSYQSIGACIALMAMLVHRIPFRVSAIIATGVMLWIAISLGTKKYKKPLVWTNRAKRICLTMWVITQLFVFVGFDFTTQLVVAGKLEICFCILAPWIAMLANIVLKPVEKHINDRYYKDAQRILASMPDLKIIGITGSYGKTSTKHYLNRILAEQFDVMMTPGSFNTPMGVIRTVREHLKPYNEVFIVEMGAKQVGDIKEICDLVHPTMGIVTAVGEQHLESFKSIENIQKTKFELIDALPADGFGVVNDDFEYVANRPVENVKCVRYAVRNIDNADYRATDIKLDSTGTTFTIVGNGLNLTLHTKLVGECNISNLMAAVILAVKLGVDEKKIQYAVEKIEQVEHRLNMKRTPAGVTIIDDAFNSNPTGSKMALEVLGAMEGGKRIVVTPGMIELGARQAELNRELGRNAARNADLVIVVGEYNREAIAAGLSDENMSKDKIHFAPTFKDAQTYLAGVLTKGDTVLYENDLPDTFK